MMVDFNGMRCQATYALSRLINNLNNHVVEGEVCIHVDQIQEPLDDLREIIGSWNCCYDKDNELFKEQSILNRNLSWFNYKDTEE